LGKAIFLFFIAVTIDVAIPAPGSCCWGGGGDDGDGRMMEKSTIEDPRLGDTGASWVGGRPLAAMAASSAF
jgi:hypothetical protein